MTYIDGFLLAVPEDKKEEYLKLAQASADVFMANGALSYVEAWGDEVPDGQLTSMPMAVKKEEGEVVCFAWISWPDKTTRDKGMKAAMEDPQFCAEMKNMPFDGKRMIFGGFDVIYEAHS